MGNLSQNKDEHGSTHAANVPIAYKQEDTSKPNMVLVCEALARIVGNKCGCKITLESLVNKETGEIVYRRKEVQAN